MLETYKQIVTNQFEAVFCTLDSCIAQCPDSMWHEPIVRWRYCQVVFHALFFSDVYLGRDLASLRGQPFHRDNTAFFSDYEELEDRDPQATYEKPEIRQYLSHCRSKASDVIASETEDSLNAMAEFDWLNFSRAELHISNIRHIQHHAAQLGLRLRSNTGEGLRWFRSGWQVDSLRSESPERSDD